jgi:hypothetical protein
MKLKFHIIFLCTFLATWSCYAQGSGRYVQSRILILLDKSSSMINPWDVGRQKSKVADEIVLRLMDSVYAVNKDVEFSLRVFGHQSTVDENNCHDTRNEVAFHKDNRLQMEYRLDDIKPLGVTSIAYALQEAADNDLVDVAHNAYSIILITDGGESCGGDICEVMRKLALSKVFFRPYIVNLESSAQLRTDYSCMGDYLEVTRQGDIPTAVSKIVTAFRPIISITPKDYSDIKEVAATAPTVLNVKIPVIKIKDTITKTGSIASLLPARILLATGKPKFPALKSVTPPGFEPVYTEEEPEKLPTYAIAALRPAPAKPIRIPAPALLKTATVAVGPFVLTEERPEPETITRLAAAALKTISVNPPVIRKPTVVTVGKFEPMLTYELPAKETIGRLTYKSIKTLMILRVIDGNGTGMPVKRVPPMPPLKYGETDAKVPAKLVAVGKPLPGKEAEFEVETEDAEKTTVEVYFTDGHGKFYSSTPQVVLLDPISGKMVKRFYRMVDGDGNPDPQTDIPPGNYHLTFTESRSLVVNNVIVQPNKKNKIVITVKKASLSFEYKGNPSRPVTEFNAIVEQRNRANGKVVRQKCTEKLEYEPENYHVVIETFPRDIRNLDLDFDERVLQIPQPGFAKFVAEPGMVSVTLYEQLGDKYRSFSTIRLSDPAAQHLQIQPGKYEAHYHKGPGGSAASEKVITFLIKATEETEIILN